MIITTTHKRISFFRVFINAITVGVFLINPFIKSRAQDLHFSQFFETPFLRNPSLAGTFTGDVRVQMVYRNQWNSISNAYKSGVLNAAYKIPLGQSESFLTTGLHLLYDKAGTVGLQTTEVLPAINYNKILNPNKQSYLAFGLMGGLVQKRIDRSKITTDVQYDGRAYNPALANGETLLVPTYNYFDASVGLSYNSHFGEENRHSYFVGAAYHHFHRPKSSYYRNPAEALNTKMVVSGGLTMHTNEAHFFTIQADYTQQGPAREIIGGVMYGFATGDFANPDYVLHGGLMWRWKDALIPVLKIDYQPFSVAISYDVNVSALKTASLNRGGFELSISYIGFLERNNRAGIGE
jgi:type IX secretion system PorP/SprF family membrane protein